MINQFLLILLAAVCGGLAAEVKVYFVGNSYTYANDLPAMFKNLAESRQPGTTVTVKSNSVGGRTLGAAAKDSGIAADMGGGAKWDYIVLQEQSMVGGLFKQKNIYPERSESEEAVRDVFSKYAIDVGATIVFYQTWGRRYGDETPFTDFYDMSKHLIFGYGIYSDLTERYGCVNTLTARAGEVFRKVYNYCGTKSNDPNWDQTLLFWRMYVSDGSHPSVTGTYAVASTLFNTIFQQQSGWSDSWYRPAGITLEDAKMLSGYAYDISAIEWTTPPVIRNLWGVFKATGKSGTTPVPNGEWKLGTQSCDWQTLTDEICHQLCDTQLVAGSCYNLTLDDPNLGGNLRWTSGENQYLVNSTLIYSSAYGTSCTFGAGVILTPSSFVDTMDFTSTSTCRGSNNIPFTAVPTFPPTPSPTATPTAVPTTAPTNIPTSIPTATPTAPPTNIPTAIPTTAPTNSPTNSPTSSPTAIPTTGKQTATPTSPPTAIPITTQTPNPTSQPSTNAPTTESTAAPTTIPTATPTNSEASTPSPTTEDMTAGKTEIPASTPSDSSYLWVVLVVVGCVLFFALVALAAFSYWKKSKTKTKRFGDAMTHGMTEFTPPVDEAVPQPQVAMVQF